MVAHFGVQLAHVYSLFVAPPYEKSSKGMSTTIFVDRMNGGVAGGVVVMTARAVHRIEVGAFGERAQQYCG